MRKGAGVGYKVGVGLAWVGVGVRVARAFRVGVTGREKGAPRGDSKLQPRVASSHKANNSPATLLRTGPFRSTFGEKLEAKGNLLFSPKAQASCSASLLQGESTDTIKAPFG